MTRIEPTRQCLLLLVVTTTVTNACLGGCGVGLGGGFGCGLPYGGLGMGGYGLGMPGMYSPFGFGGLGSFGGLGLGMPYGGCCGMPYGFGGGLIGKRSVNDTDMARMVNLTEKMPSRVPVKRRLPLVRLRQITFTTKA